MSPTADAAPVTNRPVTAAYHNGRQLGPQLATEGSADMTAFRGVLSRSLCVLAGIGLLAEAQAGELVLDPAKTYDATNFDVGGVRLGMTPDKVIEALKKT